MVKSMNPDLLDVTSVYIGRLKSKIGSLEKTINKFKKYDEERKQYYKDFQYWYNTATVSDLIWQSGNP